MKTLNEITEQVEKEFGLNTDQSTEVNYIIGNLYDEIKRLNMEIKETILILNDAPSFRDAYVSSKERLTKALSTTDYN